MLVCLLVNNLCSFGWLLKLQAWCYYLLQIVVTFGGSQLISINFFFEVPFLFVFFPWILLNRNPYCPIFYFSTHGIGHHIYIDMIISIRWLFLLPGATFVVCPWIMIRNNVVSMISIIINFSATPFLYFLEQVEREGRWQHIIACHLFGYE
jgi:hypothetical protein